MSEIARSPGTLGPKIKNKKVTELSLLKCAPTSLLTREDVNTFGLYSPLFLGGVFNRTQFHTTGLSKGV